MVWNAPVLYQSDLRFVTLPWTDAIMKALIWLGESSLARDKREETKAENGPDVSGLVHGLRTEFSRYL